MYPNVSFLLIKFRGTECELWFINNLEKVVSLVPQREVAYTFIIYVTFLQKASGQIGMGDPTCAGTWGICVHSGLTRQDTDQGPHVFYRCKNPKPSNQERNKIQITLIFLFSQGFYYLYRQNGKEVSVVNSLLLYITLCHLTFECQIGLLTQAK